MYKIHLGMPSSGKIKLGGSRECGGREEHSPRPPLQAGWRTGKQLVSLRKSSGECVDGRRPSISLCLSVLFNGDRLLVIQRFSRIITLLNSRT